MKMIGLDRHILPCRPLVKEIIIIIALNINPLMIMTHLALQQITISEDFPVEK